MKYRMQRIVSVAIATSLGLGVAALPSSAAGVGRTKYFACQGGTGLTKVSVLAHACPKGTKAVTGSFAGADFSNANLSRANLTGAAMRGTTLYSIMSGDIIGVPASLPAGWRLIKGYLVGPTAQLAGAKLVNANLAKLDLSNASFYGANLTGANFTLANLTNVSLSKANLSHAKFAGAKMTGVISAYEVGRPTSLPKNWQLVNGNYEGNVVEYLVGPGASIGGAQLGGLVFTKVNLSNIYLAGARLVGTNFSGSTILNGDLASSNLQEANFTGANVKGTNFTNADFEGANFTNANFTNANLTGARLLSVAGSGTATFTGAMCPDGVLYGSLGANC